MSPRLGAVESFLVTLGTYVAGQFASSLVYIALALGAGLFIAGNTDAILQEPYIPFVSMLCFAAATIAVIYFFLRYKKLNFGFIGVTKPNITHLGTALLGFGAYLVIYLTVVGMVSAVLPGFDVNQEQEIGFSESIAGFGLIIVFISLVILPPLAEELTARGLLFTGLRQQISFVYTTLIVSLLFAAAHLPGGKDGLLWVGALDTFILSVVLCFLREKTGSLWPAITLHALKNGLAFTLLFVFPDIIG